MGYHLVVDVHFSLLQLALPFFAKIVQEKINENGVNLGLRFGILGHDMPPDRFDTPNGVPSQLDLAILTIFDALEPPDSAFERWGVHQTAK